MVFANFLEPLIQFLAVSKEERMGDSSESKANIVHAINALSCCNANSLQYTPLAKPESVHLPNVQ